jgi:hypothetical protein
MILTLAVRLLLLLLLLLFCRLTKSATFDT